MLTRETRAQVDSIKQTAMFAIRFYRAGCASAEHVSSGYETEKLWESGSGICNGASVGIETGERVCKAPGSIVAERHPVREDVMGRYVRVRFAYAVAPDLEVRVAGLLR